MITLKEIDEIQYGICEPYDVNEMVTLLGDVFSRMDPPAVAVGLTPAEFEAFVKLFEAKAVEQKLTIIARSAGTREMAGALLTEDSASLTPDGMGGLSKKFDPIFNILGELEGEYRRGDVPHPGECLHLFLLGVSRSWGGRGVAQKLVETCLQNGLQRGYRLAVTEATNNLSQHIFRKLGFTERVQRSYQDYRFEERSPFADIEQHLGPVLMDKRIV